MAGSSPRDSSFPGMELPSSLFGQEGPFANFFRSANPMTVFQQNLELSQKFFEIAFDQLILRMMRESGAVR